MPLPKSIALLFFGLLVSSSRAEVLVDEKFTDNERLTDDPPDSLLWTYGAHHNTATSAYTSLDASAGSLLWDHSNNGANSFSGIWAHFTEGDQPFTLAIGQTLTLEFDVSFSGGAFYNGSNGFRWGLFDSNDSRVTTDFAGNNTAGLSSGTTFSSWDGYTGQAVIDSTAAAAGLLIRERTGTGDGLYTGGNYTAVGASTSANLPASAASTTYHGTLTLERTATGVTVQAGFNDVLTPAGTDTTPVTEFDTLSFFVVDGVSHDVRLDNISVTVVPEPTSTALLALTGAALLARLRRRSPAPF